MPNIVVNELSATGQACHAVAADELMRELAETYKALEPMLCGGALYAHSALARAPLTDAITVYDWLKRPLSGPMQIVRALIVDIVTKRPRVDTWLSQLCPEHSCKHRVGETDHDRTFTSLAGAAHMNAWLLSIRDCPAFPRGPVTVEFGQQAGATQPRHLEHFVIRDDATAVRRIYEANPKHKAMAGQMAGVKISAMKLKPEEAQRALDWARAIPGEKRLFSLHNDELYVFFEHLPLRFHGYLVENPREYQSRDALIYNQLQEWGWVK